MKRWRYMLAVPLALMQMPGPVAWAQSTPAPLPAALAPTAPPAAAPAPAAGAPAPETPAYSQGQLEQMLAPIALYPDELLTQVLTAATYPLEIVTADRWVKQPANAALKGDALMTALNAQSWDPSVKSLVPFPSVLDMMNTQLDWTQSLGNAFLAQQADVLAAVQSLRARAMATGKLATNAQQVVTQQPITPAVAGQPTQAIIIEPAQPSVVYVPVYNPTVVYGSWPYPSYPPVYYPPPVGYAVGSALLTGLAFGAGIAITSSLWGWGRPNWARGDVNVNVNRYNNINVNRSGSITSNTWQHNPTHRGGVAYPNNRVGQQYQPNRNNNAAQRDAFRGRAPTQGSPAQRPGTAAPNRPQNTPRPNGNTRPATPATRPQPTRPPAQTTRPQANRPQTSRPQTSQRPQQGSGAFQGVGNGATTRAQADRGQASRAAANQNRGGGGGGGHARTRGR